MREKKKVFADFEYNGQPEMETIQFGVVLMSSSGEIKDTFDSYVKPQQPVTAHVEHLTGISNENLSSASDFPSVFSSFMQWLEAYNCDYTFYAWGDDWKQLRREAKKYGMADEFDRVIPLQEKVNYQKLLSQKILFNGQMMTKALKLSDVKKLYEIPNEVSHNALSDAFDLAMVYKAAEIEKKEYQKKELKRIFDEKQNHMKFMRESTEKMTYNMYKDFIGGEEIFIAVDAVLFRKLKSGPGIFFNEIEEMIGDASAFSKKRECMYCPDSVKLRIAVRNERDSIFINYTAEYRDKKKEFQITVTDENRRFISRILHQYIERTGCCYH